MKTTGNTILITGGGSGIGRGLAEKFRALGNEVIISGRKGKTLDAAAAEIPGLKTMTVDMADAKSVESFAADLVGEYPALNVLINNAGIMDREKVTEQHADVSAAERIIATNLVGPIRLTATLLPHLLKQPYAAIMTVSSGLAFVPLAPTPTYCATKAAIHSYTQSLRYQLKDTEIQVLELIPPYVATTLTGEHQATDPRAMPLEDYVREVMDIIQNQPDETEICVQKVLQMRNSAEGGREKYEKFFKGFNDAMVSF